MTRSRRTTAVALLALLAAAAPALASTHATRVVVSRPFEANLTHDAVHEDGEPSIAVNPANPRNMIAIYLLNNDMFVPNGARAEPHVPTTREATQQIQGCDYAVTFNGGRTWAHHPLPANDFGTDPVENNCSDSIVVFDRKGIAYVMASAYASAAFLADGEYRLLVSRDGGRSWGKPTSVAPGMLSRGSHPQTYNGVRTYDDRPWLTVDPQTKALYIDGTQVRLDSNGSAFVYLTGSTDGGRTFSDPIVVPSGPLGSAPLGAAFGMVALAVPPPQGSAGCDCLDFLTSTDGARHLKKVHTTIPSDGGPQTVADPTRKGHFVVMTNDGTSLRLYRTSDAGRHWQGPTKVALQNTKPVKPWMNFSPRGVLGIGWRATRGDGSYAFYAAVSADGGRTVGVQRPISRGWSPAAPPYYVAGDDTSTLTMSNDHLYAAWGDWRGGRLEDIWWGGFGYALHR